MNFISFLYKKNITNNREHNEFVTSVHVMQDWKLDSEGNLIDVVDYFLQVSSKPDRDNTWTCTTCGAEAIFE